VAPGWLLPALSSQALITGYKLSCTADSLEQLPCWSGKTKPLRETADRLTECEACGGPPKTAEPPRAASRKGRRRSEINFACDIGELQFNWFPCQKIESRL